MYFHNNQRRFNGNGPTFLGTPVHMQQLGQHFDPFLQGQLFGQPVIQGQLFGQPVIQGQLFGQPVIQGQVGQPFMQGQNIPKVSGGAGVLTTILYNKGNMINCIALFFENSLSTSDERYHTYSVVSGRSETSDGFYKGKSDKFTTAIRELGEECTGVLPHLGNRRAPSFHVGKTPFWVASLPLGTSRRQFVPNREMSAMEYFPVENILNARMNPHSHKWYAYTIDGQCKPVSKYAVNATTEARRKGHI